MLSQRSGFPSENDIVLCTVTSVQFHSVFVKVDEYNKSGMIHISEVAPGRIRNIRDYVKEGKVIVCKVLRINVERGHIDLSLRRVSEMQRRKKINETKQEQKVIKIIELITEKGKSKELYKEILSKISDQYESVYPFFEDFVEGEASLDILGLKKETLTKLSEIIHQRIKPQVVTIEGIFKLKCYQEDGLEVIKTGLKKVPVDEKIHLTFAGGGKYNLIVEDSNYKDCEKTVKSITETIIKFFKGKNCEIEFERSEK